MSRYMKCQQQSHSNNDVHSVCINQDCYSFRPCCTKCLKLNHKDHINDVYDFSDLDDLIQNSEQLTIFQQLIEKRKQMLTKMLKETTVLQEEMKNSFKLLFNGNLQEINKSASIFIIINQYLNKQKDNKSEICSLIDNIIEIGKKVIKIESIQNKNIHNFIEAEAANNIIQNNHQNEIDSIKDNQQIISFKNPISIKINCKAQNKCYQVDADLQARIIDIMNELPYPQCSLRYFGQICNPFRTVQESGLSNMSQLDLYID